jgi:methylenetetrahydrofolate reductase (NADPH)
LRSKGIDTPVQIGVAGPATVATLIKFGLRCGIGNSLRAIRGRTNLVGGLLGESGPEALLHDVAAGLLTAPDDRITGVHFFPFGGIARTGDFVAATLSRLYREIAPAVAGSPA